MAKTKIKWDLSGFRDVRMRDDAGKAVLAEAQKVADRCGPGYIAVRGTGKNRSRASVIAVTKAAMDDNRRNNTILKNLGGA